VVKDATIHLILSITFSNGWSLRQLDVQNMFLYGVLKEEVFIKQHPGYVDKHAPDMVCKLDKAIYGLKQAPMAWYSKLSSKLQMLGFAPSKGHTSLFFYSSKSITICVFVYVDDIIVASSFPAATTTLLRDLEQEFALKDLAPLPIFLASRFPLSDSILLSQGRYAADLLHNAGMFSCKAESTTLSTSEKLSAHHGDLLGPQDSSNYHNIVGGLQYLTLTRPDIVFALNKVCQFLHSPTTIHFTAVFGTSMALLTWVLGLCAHPRHWSVVSRMLTGQGALMTVGLLVDLLYSLGSILFPGVQGSNLPFLFLALKQNTRLL
jgi:hypothetical protein